MLHKDYDSRCSFKNISGRESQRARSQDELIDASRKVILILNFGRSMRKTEQVAIIGEMRNEFWQG
jgi:hypothetical protein